MKTIHPLPRNSGLTNSLVLAGSIVALLAAPSAQAAAYVWDAGGGASTVWSSGANWNPDGAPVFLAGDTFDLGTLDIAAASTSTVDSSATLGTIRIGDNTTSSHSWLLDSTGGAVLTLDNSGAGAQINQTATSFGDTISVTLALADALNINNASTKVLTISSSITAVSGTRAITNLGTGSTTLSGVVGNGGGTVSLVQNSATGVLTLGNTNTYTGQTTVTLGTLNASATNALGTGAALLVNGGTLALSTFSSTVGAVTLTSGSITSSTGTLTGTSFAVESGTLSANLAGAGAVLTKTTSGSVTLNGANTFAGGTSLNNGTLVLGVATVVTAGTLISSPVGTGIFQVGTASQAVTLSTNVTNSTTRTLSNAISLNNDVAFTTSAASGRIALNVLNGLTTPNAITLTRTNQLTAAGGMTVDLIGAIGGSFGLTLTGGGTWNIGSTTTPDTVANTYNGLTTVSAGNVTLNKAAAVDAIAGDLTINGTGTVTLGANSGNIKDTSVVTVSIGGTLAMNAKSETIGTLILDGGTVSTTTGTLTGSNTFDLRSGTASSALAGAVAVSKTTSGAVTLSGANTYTGGTTLTAGTLNLNAAGAAGVSGPLGNGGTLTINGGTLDNTSGSAKIVLNVNPITVGSDFAFSTAAGTATANLTLPGTVDLGAVTRTITTNGAGFLALSGSISNGSLSKNGTGGLTLSGANTYTGGTTLTAGTLNLNAAGVAGVSGPLGNGGTLTINGGTLDNTSGSAKIVLNENPITVSNNFAFSTAAGTATANLTLPGTVDLGAVTRTITTNGAGYLTLSGIVSNGGLIKSGTGGLTLSGANTYSGTTTVNTGTLQFNSAGAIGGSGRSVTVASGATVSVGGGYMPDNSFLNRLVENGNTFNVNYAAPTASSTISNALDFSSSTGANLPNAVFAATPAGTTTNATTIYNGAITPGGNTYRFANLNTTNGFANNTIFNVASVLSGANSVVISGSSPVYLTGANPSYSGGTVVNAGATLGFDTTVVAALAAGSIQVGTGSTILRRGGNLDAAFLSLLAPTTNAFTIIANNAGSAGNLDLTSYPSASLAMWDQAGTQTFAFTGTITPGSNGYRFGSTRVGNNMNLINTNALTGANSVTVNGGNLRLAASMNFTGPITINAGTFTIGSPVVAFSVGTGTGSGQIGGGHYAGNITDSGTLAHTSSLDQILSGIISGTGAVTKTTTTATGTLAGTYGLTSTLTLSGLNTYTGVTTVATGTLSFNSIQNVSGGSSALGAPTTTTAGTIGVGNTTFGGTLKYTGTGHTSNRVINLAGTTGGATIDASGSGALVLTSALTATGAGLKTLTLTGSNTAGNTIGGAIVNNSATNTTSLVKSGAGNWLLSAANTYTGDTTVSGGTLNLGGGTATGSLASPVLTLSGGTFAYTRTGTNTQAFTTTNINAGVNSITTNVATQTLTLGNLVHGVGGTVDFSASPVGTTTTSTANTNGTLGGWATFGSNTWAVGNGAASAISGLAAYTLTSVAGTTAGNYTNNNIDVNNSAGLLLGAITPNSLRFNTAAATTVTLAAGDTTISSGGILVTSAVGNNLSTITGGRLLGASGADLIVNQNNPTNGLTIGSIIADNATATGLTKTGAGTLSLSAPNTYNGATAVNAGTLSLTGSLTADGPITINGNAILSESSSGIINGAASITHSSTGTSTLAGANTYTGPTTVNAGTLNLTGNRTDESGPITVQGGGILGISNGNFSVGSNTFTLGAVTGTSVVNQTGGMLTIADGSLQMLVGNGAGDGTYNLSAGTLFFTGNTTSRGIILGVNTGRTGTFNLSGTGILDMASGSVLELGRTEGNQAINTTTGIFTQSGTSSAIVGELRMGGDSAALQFSTTATLDLSGGTFSAASFTKLSGGNNSISTIRISGTANVTLPAFPTVRGTGATATISFDGGTLKPTEASATYMGGLTNAFIKAGGAKFDTTNGSITITQALLTDVVSLNGGLTKLGTNTLTLGGANTYTGSSIVSGGTLQFGRTASLYNGTTPSWTAAKIKVASAATLAFNVGGAGEFTTGDITTLLANLGGANGTSTTGFAAGSAMGFDTTNATGGTFPIADLIADSTGSGGGALGLTKLGTNRLILSGANTYTGSSIVSGGTLQFANTASLYSGIPPNWTAAKLQVASAATLAFNVGGVNEFTTGNVTTLLTNLGGINGTGTTGFAEGSAVGFDTTNAAGGNFTVANLIADSTGIGGGTLGVAKLGTNTLTLTGANTYNGATTVSAGTLVAAHASALGTTAAGTTVASDATLDVRADIDTEEISVGGPGVGGAGALVAGTGTGTSSGLVTLTANTSIGGAGTLNINGVVAAGAFTLTKVGAGTTNFGAASTLASVGTLTTNAGTTNIGSVLGSGTTTVNANATTNFTVSQTLSALNIGTVPFAELGETSSFGANPTAVVPEPGTLGLLVVGALGLAGCRRRCTANHARGLGFSPLM